MRDALDQLFRAVFGFVFIEIAGRTRVNAVEFDGLAGIGGDESGLGMIHNRVTVQGARHNWMLREKPVRYKIKLRMETTFQLTLDDWKAFESAVGGRSFWRYLFIPLALAFLALQTLADRRFMGNLRFLQLRFQLGGWNAVSGQVLAMVIPIVFIVAFMVAISIYNRHSLAKRPMFTHPITIRADDEGISGTSISGRDTIFWKAVHKLVETPTHFFILNAPQAGLIVPKCAFVSDNEAAQFISYARAQHQKAQPIVPPLSQP